ncbi:retinol dehydrogenase 12-like [Lineus longissimus]|uniref:retinol dehydrogenase 12-like n=1 Tax=Lineus longissimus TaxID=88925 RepID=UPI002B4D74FA
MASTPGRAEGIISLSEIINFVKSHKVLVASAAISAGVYYLTRRYFAGGICRSTAQLNGKTVIITGANSGIGKETAKELAKRGATVILACKDLLKAERAAAYIRKDSENKKVAVKVVDVSSLTSIRKFVEDVKKTVPEIHVLINNAGIMYCPRWVTEDGFEMQLAVNYLGPFLLSHLLLDIMKKSAPCRIINVSSLAYENGKINLDDLNSEHNYNEFGAYAQSKLAVLLYTRELSRRLQGSGVTVNAVNPGVTKSELGRHLTGTMPWWRRIIITPLIWLMFKTPLQGAQTAINCAVAPELEKVSGKYFSDCKEKEPNAVAKEDETGQRLWDKTVQLLHLEKVPEL